MEANVSSQASSTGTQPTPVSSTMFLDSTLSQNINLDLETTAWKYIQDLTGEDILKAAPPRVVQTIHPTVKAGFQDCCVVALGKICVDPSDELAWKLLFLLPCMLLTPLVRGGKHGLCDVKAAYHQFLSWNWSDLNGKSPTTGDNARKAAALRLVRCRELSRVFRILTSNGLAPSTGDTARKLISKHPSRSSVLSLHPMLVVSRSPCLGRYF